MTDQPMSFAERRRQFRAQKGLDPVEPTSQPTKPAAKSQPQVDPDLIPNVYDRSETDQQIDNVLDRVTILEAYNKWVGKKVDAATLSRDETMVSCPKPDHRDNDPSAWVNHAKGTWFCGGCQEGGDIYDIAAIYESGFSRETYKEGTEFHKLRERMFEAFGGHVHRGAAFEETVWVDEGTKAAEVIAPADNVVEDSTELDRPKEAEKSSTQEPEPVVDTQDSIATVTSIPSEDDFKEDPDIDMFAVLDWRKIVPDETFLSEYMKRCSVDDVAEEYHFWHGMMLLAHSVGLRVQLVDEPDVKANLLICILGPTSSGKSRSRRYMNEVMESILPFDASNGVFATGVKTIGNISSGEFLIRQFSHVYQDPTNPKIPGIPVSINGIVDFDEMYTLMRKIRAQTSTIRSAIMNLGDAAETIKIGSMGAGEDIAYKPFCSVIASTQPKAIRELISQDDVNSGFMNRWIFASGKQKKRLARPAFKIDLTRAKTKLKAVKDWAATERRLDFDPVGEATYEEYFNSYLEPTRNADETLMLKRLDLTAKKMMLLFAINEGSLMITEDIVNRIKPIMDYLQQCYSIVHSEIGGGKDYEVNQRIEQAIIKHIKTTGKAPTPRQIQRHLQSRKYSVEQIKKSLDSMVALDMVETEKPVSGGRGRPSIRYRVVGV